MIWFCFVFALFDCLCVFFVCVSFFRVCVMCLFVCVCLLFVFLCRRVLGSGFPKRQDTNKLGLSKNRYAQKEIRQGCNANPKRVFHVADKSSIRTGILYCVTSLLCCFWGALYV